MAATVVISVMSIATVVRTITTLAILMALRLSDVCELGQKSSESEIMSAIV